jgi:dihydrofolate synthase / folylpolyglutamate synthase
MDYRQTLDYLYARLPMFSRVGIAAFKKDLTNIIALCKFLGDPHKKFKTIHIAGTNGKGSVSHMLASILQTAGYKTGLYTSPHLKDFRERIRINRQMVDEAFVIDFTDKIKPLIEEISPSFFEITVAMAFEFFAKHQVDIAIIETGLGGRLDSTNIIQPELSVITHIGWDHMNMLGDTLPKIAAEKAGIIKKGIPVVIGEVPGETLDVFIEVAAKNEAPLFDATAQRQVVNWKWEKNELIVEVAENHQTDHRRYHLDLTGIYQTKNLLTVLEACSRLHHAGWKTDDSAVQQGLKQVKKTTGLHGRWEILRKNPLLVLDVAHNPDGINQLVQQLELTEHKNLHLIIGFVKDKDAGEMLRLLPHNAQYYFTQAHIPRAIPAEELKEIANRYDLKGNAYSNVNIALYNASVNAGKEDMILVCGSIFLVGEISPASLKAIWGADISNQLGFMEMLEATWIN